MQALQPVTGSLQYVMMTDQCEPLTFRLPPPPNNGGMLNGDVNVDGFCVNLPLNFSNHVHFIIFFTLHNVNKRPHVVQKTRLSSQNIC